MTSINYNNNTHNIHKMPKSRTKGSNWEKTFCRRNPPSCDFEPRLTFLINNSQLKLEKLGCDGATPSALIELEPKTSVKNNLSSYQ